jgi:hypothetical protein
MTKPAIDYRQETLNAITKCVGHTDSKHPRWSNDCYALLLKYTSKKRKPFMCETFRKYCEGKIEEPESLRAFGGVMYRAASNGVIKKIGIDSVKTPSSHMANAGVWISNR